MPLRNIKIINIYSEYFEVKKKSPCCDDYLRNNEKKTIIYLLYIFFLNLVRETRHQDLNFFFLVLQPFSPQSIENQKKIWAILLIL